MFAINLVATEFLSLAPPPGLLVKKKIQGRLFFLDFGYKVRVWSLARVEKCGGAAKIGGLNWLLLWNNLVDYKFRPFPPCLPVWVR